MKRARGMRLQGIGCVLIVTVMLTDHFLFSIQDGFILAMAILSAALLITGMMIVRLEDARAEAEADRQALAQRKQDHFPQNTPAGQQAPDKEAL